MHSFHEHLWLIWLPFLALVTKTKSHPIHGLPSATVVTVTGVSSILFHLALLRGSILVMWLLGA